MRIMSKVYHERATRATAGDTHTGLLKSSFSRLQRERREKVGHPTLRLGTAVPKNPARLIRRMEGEEQIPEMSLMPLRHRCSV